MNLQQRRKRIESLETEAKQLVAQMEALTDKEAVLSAEDSAEFDKLQDALANTETAIARERVLAEAAAKFAGQNDTTEPRVVVKDEGWKADPKCGFTSPASFFKAVIESPRSMTPQLRFLSAAGSDEHSVAANPYGGFLVPKGFVPNLLSVAAESDPTVSRTTAIPMTSRSVELSARTDKNHSTSVSGGLTVGRTPETQAAAASRMAIEKVELKATDLIGVSYATEQLLADSVISFGAMLEAGFREEFASKMLNEKVRGTGAGEPLGVLNSPALISVTRTTSNTLKGADITAMRKRCWNYSNAIWLANHDTLDALMAAHIALTNASVALFAPGNGTDKPDTLMGRPIYFSEYPSALGTAGDLMLVDWSQYLWGTRGGDNPTMAESVHVRFLENERTFRFSMANDGRPWWRSAITPKNGANTLSPYVTVAT